jgi:hypothetical protein
MTKRLVTLALTLALVASGAAFAAAEGGDALTLYTKMHAAMAADSADGVAAAAAELASVAQAGAAQAKERAAYDALAAAASKMTGNDLAKLREQFKEVSKAFAAYVDAGGATGAQLYYCPMAEGYWAQRTDDAGVKNPYYGKSMLKCGGKVDKVEG